MLKKNVNEIIASIRNGSLLFENLSINYKRNKDIIREALNITVDNYQYVDTSLKNDKQYFKELISIYEDSILFVYAGQKVRFDKEMFLLAMSYNKSFDLIQYTSLKNRSDKKFLIKIIKEIVHRGEMNLDLLEYLDEKILSRNFIISVIKADSEFYFEIDEKYKNDLEFLKTVVKYNSNIIMEYDIEIQKILIKVKNVQLDELLYRSLDNSLRYDKDIVLLFLKYDYNNINALDDDFVLEILNDEVYLEKIKKYVKKTKPSIVNNYEKFKDKINEISQRKKRERKLRKKLSSLKNIKVKKKI